MAMDSLKKKIEAVDSNMYGPTMDSVAAKMYEDRQMHMNSVTSTFN